MHFGRALMLAGALMVLGAFGVSDDRGQAREADPDAVAFDAADFVVGVDNAWWPMPSGARWIYRDRVAHTGRTIVVDVMPNTSTVRGVAATTLRTTVRERRTVTSGWLDYYAQDTSGNVWHLGRRMTLGARRSGSSAVRAEIVVAGQPLVGMTYSRHTRILSFDQPVKVPGGQYERTLVVARSRPADPHPSEHTIFARGVGPALTITVSSHPRVIDLVRYFPGAQP